MFARIKKSFLNQEKIVRILAPALILTFMFFIAYFSSNGCFGIPGDSGTSDETAHIPAGYAYIKDLDYRLNPEHPPLAKALSGIFLVLAGINGPENEKSWNDVDEFESGRRMIYGNINNADKVLFWARLPMMLLMIGLGILLYKWALQLYGLKIGLLVLTFFAFYPDIIAHGRLVTTDIAAAFGYLITIYSFDKAIREKTRSNIAIAGICFGVAQLLKFSVILLYPILLALVIIKAHIDKSENKNFYRSFRIYFRSYLWICLISIFFVWIIYTLFTWRTPPEIEHKLIVLFFSEDPSTLELRNFLHMFEGNPFTRGVGHYFLGIMCVIGRVIFGCGTFILGIISLKSFAWFFPVAWLLKTPITIILLFFSSLAYIIIKFPKENKDKWTLALLLTTIAFYWIVSIIGSLNIGVRHLMPTIPFVLLLIGFFCWKIFEKSKGRTAPKIIVLILLGYMAASTLSNYPYFISYFNEATPREKRYTRLIDSSLDWGQDLLRLKKYLQDNNIKDVNLDFFSSFDPRYYIPDAKIWNSEYGPTSGWLVVSATFYQLSKIRGVLCGKWSYHWLDSRKPKAIIGGSILVFYIDKNDLVKNPPVSPYEITKTVEPYKGRKFSIILDIVENILKK